MKFIRFFGFRCAIILTQRGRETERNFHTLFLRDTFDRQKGPRQSMPPVTAERAHAGSEMQGRQVRPGKDPQFKVNGVDSDRPAKGIDRAAHRRLLIILP